MAAGSWTSESLVAELENSSPGTKIENHQFRNEVVRKGESKGQKVSYRQARGTN